MRVCFKTQADFETVLITEPYHLYPKMSMAVLSCPAILHLPVRFITEDKNQELFPARMQKAAERES
jgi:hypothetical protein